MEPHNQDELTDRELDALLQKWRVPEAPAPLRQAIFPDWSRPWWRRLWSASVRIPLPVAVAVLLLLAAVWRWPVAAVPQDRQQLQPVSELRPVILRGVQ